MEYIATAVVQHVRYDTRPRPIRLGVKLSRRHRLGVGHTRKRGGWHTTTQRCTKLLVTLNRREFRSSTLLSWGCLLGAVLRNKQSGIKTTLRL